MGGNQVYQANNAQGDFLNIDIGDGPFQDITDNLPGLVQFGGGNGGQPAGITYNTTLTARQSLVQFIPLGEYR